MFSVGMMKRRMGHLGFWAVLVLGGALLSGCQDNGGGTSAPAAPSPYYPNGYLPNGAYPYNNGPYATTPQPCSFNAYYPNQTMCNQFFNQFQTYYPNWGMQYPNMSWHYGAWFWPTQVSHVQGYCGCPSGYSPVYGSTFGVSCAPNAYFNNWSVVWMNVGFFGGPAQNQAWLNSPQVHYSGNGTCGQMAQGCDVRLNNCSAGYMCRPVAGGSTIGLCSL